MHKKILFLAGLLLPLALLGCRGPQRDGGAGTLASAPTAIAATEAPGAAATDEPREAAASREAEPEGERILSHCLSVLDRLPYGADLAGDGTVQTLDLATCTPADGYPRWAIVLTTGDGEKRFETDVPYDMAHDLWVGDLDEDGAYEIFFHGDMASDDYVIYGFRSDLSPLLFEPDERAVRWGGDAVSNVFDGYIEGFEDGHIVIKGTVDMLGTHWGVRNYALGDDGVIGPVSTVWTFDEDVEEERPLTVKRAVTAYRAAVRKDPGEAFTLEVGERIYPLASDGCERLWFFNGEGQERRAAARSRRGGHVAHRRGAGSGLL